MKEVERFSLGGYAFTLEEDAATLVGEYLGKLEKYYEGREGGPEILEGIEERMAELLLEKAGREGVCTKEMIDQIIGILGRPEIIEAAGEEEENPGPDGKDEKAETRGKRKLYRDMNDRVVAGVCSGLAAYFRIDVALPRILFALFSIVFLLGWHWNGHHTSVTVHLFVPILYAILWICMPPARTAKQRWEQRGEDGTLHGIQQSIENGAKEIDDAVRSIGNSKAAHEFGVIFEKLIGVILLIVAFSVLFAGGVISFGSGILGNKHSFFGLGELFDRGMSELSRIAPSVAATLVHPWVHALAAVVIFLPFLGILYGALQLLFGFKSPKWHPGLVLFVLWLMSLLALAILVITGVVSTQFLTI
ncbi:MAG: PspC domain-containing protein [Bacteroidales bacterium]|nr:PspC domain-containing protein [Bacteroidales bacterium]